MKTTYVLLLINFPIIIFCCLYLLTRRKSRKLFSFFNDFKNSDSLVNLPFEVPTDEELERAIVVKPPSFWGNQIRTNLSVRILMIGGSNSQKSAKYPIKLNSEIEMLKAEGTLNKNSYLIVEGASMAGPDVFYFRVYDFEKKLDLKNWPNLIILEFSITVQPSIDSIFQLDNLIHIIKRKWEKKNLLAPSFLIIDLFSTSFFYDGSEILWDYIPNLFEGKFGSPNSSESTASNLKKINRVDFDGIGFNRGNKQQQYIYTIAHFYRIPLISLTEAMWPSFTRFFINSSTIANRLWPFSDDGRHLSKLGATYLVKRLIIPFLVEQLQRKHNYFIKNNENQTSIYNYDVRLFPHRFYTTAGVVGSWTSWGGGENTLKNIIIKNEKWDFLPTQKHENDKNHICYGTFDKYDTYENNTNNNNNNNNNAYFRLDLYDRNCRHKVAMGFDKSLCDKTTKCNLLLTYIHSWNTSYIGSLKCNLYNIKEMEYDDNYINYNKSHSLLENDYIINGNTYQGKNIKTTGGYKHLLYQNLTCTDNHILKCFPYDKNILRKNKSNNKLSCIATIEIIQLS